VTLSPASAPPKPAVWETIQICVSHYAACITPFALTKPGYPPMRATKHQRTALRITQAWIAHMHPIAPIGAPANLS
jgi:hypothetical protein